MRNRYGLSIFAFAAAMTMFMAASHGANGSKLASLNVADIVLLMGSGFFAGIGVLALFDRLRLKRSDRVVSVVSGK